MCLLKRLHRRWVFGPGKSEGLRVCPFSKHLAYRKEIESRGPVERG